MSFLIGKIHLSKNSFNLNLSGVLLLWSSLASGESRVTFLRVLLLEKIFLKKKQGLESSCFLKDFDRCFLEKVKVFFLGEVFLGVSKNRDTPKSSIQTGFSLINHPFWGTIILGNTHLII